MKAIKTILVAVAMGALVASYAQSGQHHVEDAMSLYKSGDIEKSREAIEKALEYDDMGANAYAWHFKGFIYKELFKSTKKGERKEELRELSAMSIDRSIELDIPDQYEEANFKALEFLALTFQKEGYELSKSKKLHELQEAEKKFNRFSSFFDRLYPDSIDYSAIGFYNALGRSYIDMADKGPLDKSAPFREKALEAYTAVLKVDSDNYIATVNSGITIYNQAVAKIKAIDYRTEIFELIVVQDECVILFKDALPYFQRAYRLEPKKSLPLQALVACYKSLNEVETATRFEDIKAELLSAGELDD